MRQIATSDQNIATAREFVADLASDEPAAIEMLLNTLCLVSDCCADLLVELRATPNSNVIEIVQCMAAIVGCSKMIEMIAEGQTDECE